MTWRLILLALVLAGIGLRLTFFATSVAHLQPSSDESITMLMAEEIRQGDVRLLFMAQPYLFPLESYWIAPFVRMLPHDAFGARLPALLMHLAAVGLWLVILRRLCAGAAFAAAAALVLAPSCYVLMIQSGYALPGYPSLLLLFAVNVLLADRARRAARPAPWLAASGFFAGLAFSGHMLALPYVAACAVFACVAQGWRAIGRRALVFGTGTLAGLGPFIVARILFPGAHAAVTAPVAWTKVLKRLWSPTLDYTLAGTLGLYIPPFPDETAGPGLFPALAAPFAALVAALLLGLAIWRGARAAAALRQRRLPQLELVDLLLAVALLNLLLFATNKRADSSSYRYLLLTAAAFPLLLGRLAARGRAWTAAVLLLSASLVALNLGSARRLLDQWRAPDFAERVAKNADLRPALDVLRDLDVSHAVASYGAAYRIAFLSGGRVTCAQPFNERFPHWPLPFKEEVDRVPRVAYVLTEGIRFLKPSVFERHLEAMGVTCSSATAGAFQLYYDFQADYDFDRGRLLPPDRLTTRAQPPAMADKLNDGAFVLPWTTPGLQQGGEWIEATWDEPLPLNRAVLLFGIYRDDYPRTLDVHLLRADGWQPFATGLPGAPDKFEVRFGRPLYGRTARILRLNGEVAAGIRVLSNEPRTNRNWTVAEIEIYTEAPHDGDETTGRPGGAVVSSAPSRNPFR